jgi:hypothetical protein
MSRRRGLPAFWPPGLLPSPKPTVFPFVEFETRDESPFASLDGGVWSGGASARLGRRGRGRSARLRGEIRSPLTSWLVLYERSPDLLRSRWRNLVSGTWLLPACGRACRIAAFAGPSPTLHPSASGEHTQLITCIREVCDYVQTRDLVSKALTKLISGSRTGG